MITLNTSDLLFVKLENDSFGQTKSADPLDINSGYLGAAYLAASMAQIDDSQDWRQVTMKQLNHIFKQLGASKYSHGGMLGGLAGLALLLQTSKQDPAEYVGALHKIETRLLHHVRCSLEKLQTSIGMPRFDYDYAIGLTGILYYFELFPPAEREQQELITGALQYLVGVAKSSFDEFFWTPSIAVPHEVVQQEPKAAFGILDFGQAHGISGVLGLFLAHVQRTKDHSVQEAIPGLLAALVRGYDTSIVPGIPYYLCGHPESESWLNDEPVGFGSGPTARNGWCYGLPILEIYMANYGLAIPKRLELSFTSPEYVDPRTGGFDGPGLCHGIAGRMALNYLMRKPIPDIWWERAEQQLQALNDVENSGLDFGFWDGIGGLQIVVQAISQSKPLPKQLQILGLPYEHIAL
ncbi:lanthionine synthetase LanC family protein [Corynebacterium freiburgense]|uniref:lanthionine synthetase LanC family protein n=1 Tax=Corynebacterium freiburgense TaxID=556548 RepID=UPI00040CAF48|nr:lanthionine synthetase LanC family protein [Corynebacterium freiburgense]WJZ01867.1 Nisin biosynthesis protein NisC [Corynebacterium freiburgense]